MRKGIKNEKRVNGELKEKHKKMKGTNFYFLHTLH